MSKLFPHPILSLFLTVFWLLLNNSFSLGLLVFGGFLGWLIPLYTQRFWKDSPRGIKLAPLIKLYLIVIYDVIIANLIVAKQILFQARSLQSGFIEIPLEIQNPYAIAQLASIITMTPGTVSANLSEDRNVLLVHALHVTDKQALVDEIKQRYEKPLKEGYEC